jgi:error-prone DNA polymerase
MTTTELVRAELDVLSMDVRCHVLDFHAPMLKSLGIVRSNNILSCRSEQEVLVAGVKVATQTPPVRSGRRVIFLTLDDSTGPVDATFFEDAQDVYASTVFSSWLVLVRGHVRRTGPRGVSIRATGCWSLGLIRDNWLAGGARAVLELLAADRQVAQEPVRRRVLVHPSGVRQSPYADVRPAGPHVGGRWSV